MGCDGGRGIGEEAFVGFGLMNVKLLDTFSGESVWTSDLDPDEVSYGMWGCDCMRAVMFNPRRHAGCSDDGDCRGYQRWIVVDRFCVEEDDADLPTLHECNNLYPEELLVVNGIELD